MDHYKNPRNSGDLPGANSEVSVANSSCGDEIELKMLIEDGKVTNIAHTVQGCAICTAAMSMLSEKVKGLSTEEIDMMEPEVVLEMIGMEPTSGRIKCALLSLDAVKKGIKV